MTEIVDGQYAEEDHGDRKAGIPVSRMSHEMGDESCRRLSADHAHPPPPYDDSPMHPRV